MSRPSASLVVSCVALFVALGGSGYAIARLPSNSVGPAQLRDGAVTGAKVRNGSLSARDFRAGQIPAGADGRDGAAGPPGPRGPAGTSLSGGARAAAFSVVSGQMIDPVLPEGWAPPVVGTVDEGVFQIRFDRSIATCTPVAASGFDEEEVYPRVVTVDRVAGEPAHVAVRVSDTEGFAAAVSDFRFVLLCPPEPA